MMSFNDPSTALLAACGGDTVKLFDVSVDPGDPCILSYIPSAGSQVNSVKWNHTNLVVASAGDDRKISLWRKNGQSMGTIPVSGSDSGDNIDESILAISFSSKSSRYICSGGSGQVVRIWDLQRKRCIKWLKGHTDTITGAMYNCKDEYLASISLKGDLILHNLSSGARVAEFKDPKEQVLRVLDYSRISRHLLVTAGDDGSVHLWDTTGRSPKISWLKQHSAPTTGVSFSPSNDKIIASVGLDKKLYTFDSSTKRSTFCIPYEAPFSSLAFRDDGWILAAGTSSGRVVFYDVRGKPQPFTVLRAYGSSEAVTSLCWQRSKPITINESNCNAEIALLGGAGEDSILMPDPLPSVTSSSLSLATAVPGSRNPGRSSPFVDSSSLMPTSSGSTSSTMYSSNAEETPNRNHLWTGATLSRLQAPRTSYNFKDDMEVFSPLVDVQPITPSLDKLWDDHEEGKKDNVSVDKKPASLLSPSPGRRYPFADDGGNIPHPISDWKFNSISRQDDARSSSSLSTTTPVASSKSEESSTTPPEVWGGEALHDKFNHHRQAGILPSRFGTLMPGSIASTSNFSGLQDSSLPTSFSSTSSLANANLNYPNLRARDTSSSQETSLGLPEHVRFSSLSMSQGTKSIAAQANLELPVSTSLTLPRRFSTYAERISSTPSFSDGAALATGSPKAKKTGAETREELISSFLSRSEIQATTGSGIHPVINGETSQSHRIPSQPDMQQGTSSFTLQLVQRTLEETLASVQKSIHEDMRNLHIEILRQFHLQEMEMTSVMNSILEKQAELMKEVQSLRKENQQLRQLL
ncbi:protein NEDD1 [Telopea speciosissima]|uniref:protein NEDD1 n=1 Tax=Telopea speciosissima TaxID=54955 RepID=UPI001CC3495A|nr:protein NEDD1 [Telopea speciosissima]XP_043713089.1 protein NEDD1 [Telopea speciosissima]